MRRLRTRILLSDEAPRAAASPGRLEQLEQRVVRLEAELAELKRQLGIGDPLAGSSAE